MRDNINAFFDLIQLISERLSVLDRFVVEVALLLILIVGVRALLAHHP